MYEVHRKRITCVDPSTATRVAVGPGKGKYRRTGVKAALATEARAPETKLGGYASWEPTQRTVGTVVPVDSKLLYGVSQWSTQTLGSRRRAGA